jgi:hypothetical protein
MTSRPVALIVAAVAATLSMCGLAACGDDVPGADSGSSGPLTARAVAAVMLDHLPEDTSSRRATYVDEHSPEGLVGADLRYSAGEGEEGDLVQVTVSKGKATPCGAGDERCAELDGGVVLRWEELAPEEDPGGVYVQVSHDGQLVSALAAGPAITGDPRDLDVEPSVETMVDLVQDPRLRLQSDGATFAAGEALDDWDGGEVDAASLEMVPQTDSSIVAGWIWGYGDDWRYVGPSPLKDVFGKGAIGGRVEVTDMGPLSAGFLDALAAPQPPAWLGDGCLDGYLCEKRDGLHLVWRPAVGDDPGDAYVVHVLEDGETVAFHSAGNRLGPRWAGAFAPAGGPFWAGDLTYEENPLAIRLTTTKERFDQAEVRAQRHR